MEIADAGLGDVVELDVRVFHKAGMDGTHHVEEGIEYVIMDDPEDGPAMCVLTVEQEDELRASLASYLYTQTLPLRAGEHQLKRLQQIADIVDVRRG